MARSVAIFAGTLTAVAAVLPVAAAAAVSDDATAYRTRQSLADDWRCREAGTTDWKRTTLPGPFAASWGERVEFRRELTVPETAAGRRSVLAFDLVATKAVVEIDGKDVGTVVFPGGELDVTDVLRPGTHEMTLDVSAYPFRNDTLDYNAPDRLEKTQSSVRWRGVTGNVWLETMPSGVRLSNGRTVADVKRRTITFATDVVDGSDESFILEARVTRRDKVWRFSSKAMKPDARGRLSFAADWKDAPVWDIHQSDNLCRCSLALKRTSGTVVDRLLPFAFGFRDVGIDGRDIKLNGKTVHLRALMNDTAGAEPVLSTPECAREVCRRAKEAGFNLLVARNYHFRPGAVHDLDVILDACDAAGLLYSFSMPHFADFGDLQDAAVSARYRALVRWIVARVGSHPSLVLWATSHNATGFVGDQNPQRIDGVWDLPPDGPDSCFRNRRMARIAERIIREEDPTRPVYHHESGNLGAFHTANCYLNWAPIQERSEWLGHWAEKGVKPVFLVEYGLPHIASWSSFRGPEFIWSCPAFQSAWLAEYAAAFLGDAAYRTDEPYLRLLSYEEALWKSGRPFRFGDLVGHIESCSFFNYGIKALYVRENWRAMRAWGASALLGWDQEDYFRRTTECPDVTGRFYWTGGGSAADFAVTDLGKEMVKWNADEIAFIGGAEHFSGRRHVYRAGAELAKTLVILNDTREDEVVKWTCRLTHPDGHELQRVRGAVSVPAGGRTDVPVSLKLSKTPGDCRLDAGFAYASGTRRTDSMRVRAVPVRRQALSQDVLLYDPAGLTAAHFARLGIACDTVGTLDAQAVSGKKLVVGRGALTRELLQDVLVPACSAGARVLIFEQDQKTLESCGFRVQKYGLRRAFARYRWQPLDGLDAEDLRDWGGSSTLVAPDSGHYPPIETWPPREQWAGYLVDRVWRCGNRGTVASVLPEKPSVGDWCALVDGGFDLQYAPLLLWRLNRGWAVFCQLDVTGRDETDVSADDLTMRLVRAFDQPGSDGSVCMTRVFGLDAEYALRARHVRVFRYPRPGGEAFVVSSGAEIPTDFHECVARGAKALCLGLTAAEVKKWSPVPLACVETNGCHFSRIARLPPELNGLSNGDWAWHGTMDFAAFQDENPEGNPAFRIVRHGNGTIVFWQVPPWKIDDRAKPYLRTSRRRAEAMLSRLLGNMGFSVRDSAVRYADAPLESDDPYRYFRW